MESDTYIQKIKKKERNWMVCIRETCFKDDFRTNSYLAVFQIFENEFVNKKLDQMSQTGFFLEFDTFLLFGKLDKCEWFFIVLSTTDHNYSDIPRKMLNSDIFGIEKSKVNELRNKFTFKSKKVIEERDYLLKMFRFVNSVVSNNSDICQLDNSVIYSDLFVSIKKICEADKCLQAKLYNKNLLCIQNKMPVENMSFFLGFKKMWGTKNAVKFIFLKTPLKKLLNNSLSVSIEQSRMDILMSTDSDNIYGDFEIKTVRHGIQKYKFLMVKRIQNDYIYLVYCNGIRLSTIEKNLSNEYNTISGSFVDFVVDINKLPISDITWIINHAKTLKLDIEFSQMIKSIFDVHKLISGINTRFPPYDIAMFRWSEYCGSLLSANCVMSEIDLRNEFSVKYPSLATIVSNSDKSIYQRFSEKLLINFKNRTEDKSHSKNYLKYTCPLFKLYYTDSNIILFKKECDGHLYVDGTHFGEKDGIKLQLIIFFSTLKTTAKYAVISFCVTKAGLDESEFTILFKTVRESFCFIHMTTDFDHACLNALRKLGVSIWGCMYHFANRNVRSKAVLYRVPVWIYHNILKLPFMNIEERGQAMFLLLQLNVTVENKCISDFLNYVHREYFMNDVFQYSFTSSKTVDDIRYMWTTNSALESYNHVFKSYASKCRNSLSIHDSFIHKILYEQDMGIFLMNRGISKYSHQTDYKQQFYNNFNKFSEKSYSELEIVRIENYTQKTGKRKRPFDLITKEKRAESKIIKDQNDRVNRRLREHIPTCDVNTQTDVFVAPDGFLSNADVINKELENCRLLNKAIEEYSNVGDFYETTPNPNVRLDYRTFSFGNVSFSAHQLILEQIENERIKEQNRVEYLERQNYPVQTQTDMLLDFIIGDGTLNEKSKMSATTDNIQDGSAKVIVTGQSFLMKTNSSILSERNSGIKLIIRSRDENLILYEKKLIKECLDGYSMRMIDSYFENNNMINASISLNEQVVSACVFFVDQNKRQAEIIALGTSVFYRKNGYGSSLISGVIDELSISLGIKFVSVLSDKVAVDFYEKMGFRHFTSFENNLFHLFNIRHKKGLSLVLETESTMKSNKNIIKQNEMFGFFKEKFIEIGRHFKKSPKDTKSEPKPAEIFGLCKRSGISDGNDLQAFEEEIINSKKIKITELENENLKKLLKEEQIKREADQQRAEDAYKTLEKERLAKETALNQNMELIERIKQLEEAQVNILTGSLKKIKNLKQFKPINGGRGKLFTKKDK